MSVLRDEAALLHTLRADMREVHTGYDRVLFRLVSMLVDEVEHLRGGVESLERTLHSRTDHLA